ARGVERPGGPGGEGEEDSLRDEHSQTTFHGSPWSVATFERSARTRAWDQPPGQTIVGARVRAKQQRDAEVLLPRGAGDFAAFHLQDRFRDPLRFVALERRGADAVRGAGCALGVAEAELLSGA